MRLLAVAAVALGLAAGPFGDVGDVEAIEVERVVDPVVDAERTEPRRESETTSGVIPDVVRHVIDELPGRKPSIQDHDDVEDTDRPEVDVDVPEEDDGRVISGEFEGGSVEQGHNTTTTRP